MMSSAEEIVALSPGSSSSKRSATADESRPDAECVSSSNLNLDEDNSTDNRTQNEEDNDNDDNGDGEEPSSPNSSGDFTAEDSSASGVVSEQYRDFYLMGTTEIKAAMGTPPPKRKGPRGGVASAFPVKLHEMLSRTMFEGTDHIVSWAVHGRSFTVHQPSIFVDELMPRYFKQSKMTSFQRQLNLYGFMRKTDGTDRGAYYHELFLRGRPDLAKIMVRTRVKGDTNQKRRIMAEPDFYKMPYCPEDPDPRQDSSVRHPMAPSPRGSYYREDTLRSPRSGYTTTAYYPYPGSSREHHREPDASSLAAEVTPCSKTNVLGGGTTEYMTAGTATLPSSSFFLDEEPPLNAPENSMWTPPPFPDEQRAHRSRERPSYPVIQPSRGSYPPVVSPEADLYNRYGSSRDRHGQRPPQLHHFRRPSPFRTSSSRDPYARERTSYVSAGRREPHHHHHSRRHGSSEHERDGLSRRSHSHHPYAGSHSLAPRSSSSAGGAHRWNPAQGDHEVEVVAPTRESSKAYSDPFRHGSHHHHSTKSARLHHSPHRPTHRVSLEETPRAGASNTERASSEGRTTHDFFDEGAGFQPVDDTSLEMFETSFEMV